MKSNKMNYRKNHFLASRWTTTYFAFFLRLYRIIIILRLAIYFYARTFLPLLSSFRSFGLIINFDKC